MFDAQVFRAAIQDVDLGGGFHNLVDATPFEIGVSQWRANEAFSRGERADHMMEIERDFGQRIIEQTRHVALACPALDAAIHVIAIRIQAATGYNHYYAIIDNR